MGYSMYLLGIEPVLERSVEMDESGFENVECGKPRGRPRKTWINVVEVDMRLTHSCSLFSKGNMMTIAKFNKLILALEG